MSDRPPFVDARRAELERDLIEAALDAGTAEAEASAASDAWSAANERANAAQRRLDAATRALRAWQTQHTPVAELARTAGGLEVRP